MHVCSIALLGATALHICVLSSSSFNKTEVSAPTSAHSNVHDQSSLPVNRLVRAHNTTNMEERMPQKVPTLALKKMCGFSRNTLWKAMVKLHDNRNADMLTEKALGRLMDLDFHVLAPFAVEIHRRRNGKKVQRAQRKNSLYRTILRHALDSADGEKHLVRAILSQKRTPTDKMYQVKRDIPTKREYLYYDLDSVGTSGVTFEGYESLNWLLKYFGGLAKLAPVVSIAKKSQVIGHKAEQLQSAMLARWLTSDTSVDEVFSVLDLFKLRTRGFTYENLDTLQQYIRAYNKKQKHGLQIDFFTYLRGKFGDGELGMMILEGTMTPQFVNEKGFRELVGVGKSTVDFVCDILIIAVDVDSLLNPLLLAFGGVAKLAPIVSSAKKSHAARTDAKRLQSTMLTRWLNSGKSIYDVVDILELSDLSQRDFTFEKVDTLEQYVALYNEKHGIEKDTFKYLIKTLGVGEPSMVLPDRKVS